MVRKTRRHSHKRRHSRRHTRKYHGGRGGMGGAELGHAYTTGASQELYQMTGRTPGLSSGGGSPATKRRRQAALALAQLQRNANREAEKRALLASLARAAANEGKRRSTQRRHKQFKNAFVVGMPIPGYEGNRFRNKSRSEMRNMLREEALSEYVRMFGNEEGFNELSREHYPNNNNNNNNRN